MEFKCFYVFIYIVQDKDTSALCIKLKNIFEIYKMDRRTFVKWHVQIIIAKRRGNHSCMFPQKYSCA